MIIEHASVSRLSLYEQCSLRYRFKYHEKIKPPLPDPSFLYLGKLVHAALERFVISGLTSNCGMGGMQRLIIEVAKEGDYNGITPEDIERLPVHLGAFLKLQRDIEVNFPGRSEMVEWPLPPSPIVSGFDHDGVSREVAMAGFVDRLIFHDGRAMIIDYKTTRGKNQKSIAEAMVDPQLKTYAYFVWRVFGIQPELITTMLFYLENAKKVPATFTAGDLEEHIGAVKAQSLAILAAQPDAAQAKVNNFCRFCDYRTICPARQRIDRMMGGGA